MMLLREVCCLVLSLHEQPALLFTDSEGADCDRVPCEEPFDEACAEIIEFKPLQTPDLVTRKRS